MVGLLVDGDFDIDGINLEGFLDFGKKGVDEGFLGLGSATFHHVDFNHRIGLRSTFRSVEVVCIHRHEAMGAFSFGQAQCRLHAVMDDVRESGLDRVQMLSISIDDDHGLPSFVGPDLERINSSRALGDVR